jgi:hypothetical protein
MLVEVGVDADRDVSAEFVIVDMPSPSSGGGTAPTERADKTVTGPLARLL